MKILIAYTSAGSGHFKAAHALYNYLKQKNTNLELRLVDVLDNSCLLFKSIYSSGYAFLVSYLPWAWALGFYITSIKPLRPVIKQMAFLINRLNTLRFARFLIREDPDFIISTHFLPSDIAADLKRRQRINSKIVTVITDFGVHPFWLSDGRDIYIVASNFTKQQLVRDGIKENRVKVLGIPIGQKFLAGLERHTLLKKFNLEDKFTVLVVTGSFGIGPIERIVDLLHKDVRVLAVCARNKALFKRLKRKNYPNVLVFGFIDNIEELMAISDIIITKPGGLTISEILAMELPPIFIAAIPGQETANIETLERCGVGLSIKDVEDIKDLVLDYKNHPDKINMIKENIIKIKKPDVLSQIYNVVCQGGAGDTG